MKWQFLRRDEWVEFVWDAGDVQDSKVIRPYCPDEIARMSDDAKSLAVSRGVDIEAPFRAA
jgi:hypothetical protein